MLGYPPQTEEVKKLAEFFDQVDTTDLNGLGEVPDPPEHDLISVSLRLPRRDVEVLKRVASGEGLAPSTFMRWVLHRFVKSLTSTQKS